jgi:uncharacterized protein YndB with AHSA1/START domain
MNTISNTALKITREINAPIAQVFAAWTNPELAQKWWGPEGVRTRELIIEPRAGGKFWWVLSTPEGEEMTAQGVYSEVLAGEKVSFTWHWVDDPDWETHESLVTVEFRAEGTAITELLLTHENLPNETSRDNHTEGWNSALDKLERFLSTETGEVPEANQTSKAA